MNVPLVGNGSLLALAVAVSLICLAGGMIASWLIRPSHPDPLKLEPYECGEPTVGPSQIRFRTFFYLFALVFVIFDVEVIFLFPWAVVFQSLGLFAFVEMAVFIGILLLGLAYAWKKGALRWQ